MTDQLAELVRDACARQGARLELAGEMRHLHQLLVDLVNHPGPTVTSDGQILLDQHGQPVPNAEVRRLAEDLLAQVRGDPSEPAGDPR